jgi:hypothetical protein
VYAGGKWNIKGPFFGRQEYSGDRKNTKSQFRRQMHVGCKRNVKGAASYTAVF